jgi:hypothetical protein
LAQKLRFCADTCATLRIKPSGEAGPPMHYRSGKELLDYTGGVIRTMGVFLCETCLYTLFANCTTTLIEHINRVLPTKVPFLQRRMMNGYTDHAAYENGWLAGHDSFEELRSKSNINARALKADQEPDFSRKIRTHFEPDQR